MSRKPRRQRAAVPTAALIQDDWTATEALLVAGLFERLHQAVWDRHGDAMAAVIRRADAERDATADELAARLQIKLPF